MQRVIGRQAEPRFSNDVKYRSVRSRERIRFDIPLTEEDVDWYGRGAAGVLGIGASHQDFVQPVTGRTAGYTPVVSSKGVSRKACAIFLIVFALALLTPLSGSIMALSDASKTVAQLDSSIEKEAETIADLEVQLASANSQYDVRYLAAQMDMHAATYKDIVYLTLPDRGN